MLYVTRARRVRQAELWGRGRGRTTPHPLLSLTPVLGGSHLIFTQWQVG